MAEKKTVNKDFTSFKNLKSMIDVNARHRLWAKWAPVWDTLARCYKGGYDFRPVIVPGTPEPESISFLRRHSKETDEDYIGRHNASFYTNHLKTIYDRYAMYIFGVKNEIVRSFEPENDAAQDYYETYINNFDLMGTHVSEYQNMIFNQALTYGICYSLIDKTLILDKTLSVYEKRLVKPRSWSTLIDPRQLVNWSQDEETGHYNWILIKSNEEKLSAPSSSAKLEDVYYYWDREKVLKINSDNNLVDGYPRPNELGKVPLIPCYLWDFEQDGMPEPFSIDLADLNIEHYNTSSLVQEEMDNATFPLFIVPKKEFMSTDEKLQEMKRQDEEIIRGVKRALRVDKDSKILPQYANYPTNTLEFKEDYKKQLINEMDQIAHEKAAQIAETNTVQSGFAIHQQMGKKFMFIALMAFKMQNIEMKHWDLIKEWDYDNPDKAPKINVEYPSEWDAYDSAESRANLDLIIEKIPSPTLKAEATMKWARELYPNMDSTLEKQISEELIMHYEKQNQKESNLADIYNIAKNSAIPQPALPETEEEAEAFAAEEVG